MKLIYLAIPYTYNPNESFEIANKLAAKLMQQGNIVFSPISHSHMIADNLPEHLRFSQKFWMKQDLPILEKCDELFIVIIGENGCDLIENSKGCKSEIQHAKDNNIPVRYIKYTKL